MEEVGVSGDWSQQAGSRRPAASSGEFEEFYRQERDGLYRALALTIGDTDLAAEAVDEAMVRAYPRWPRLRGYEEPAAWVYRTAFNWAVSRLRRRRRLVTVPQVEDEEGRPDPPPADERLVQALAALPGKQRAVVVLRYHLDWSERQVAAALGVPPGTVKSRLHRGVTALREHLKVTS